MNRIRALIRSADPTWDELKDIINTMIKEELSKPISDIDNRDKVFAEVHRRAGIQQIVNLIDEIEKSCL